MLSFKFTISLLALFNLALAASNSSSTSAEFSCLIPCDRQAVAAANCTWEDSKCHCQHSQAIVDYIVPCIQTRSNCTNTTASVDLFETTLVEFCQDDFNISIPVPANATVNSTSSSNSTTVTSPSATASSYTGAAAMVGSSEMVMGVSAALMAVLCFGML